MCMWEKACLPHVSIVILPPSVSWLLYLAQLIVLWSIFTVLTYSVGFCASLWGKKTEQTHLYEDSWGRENEKNIKSKGRRSVITKTTFTEKPRKPLKTQTGLDISLFLLPFQHTSAWKVMLMKMPTFSLRRIGPWWPAGRCLRPAGPYSWKPGPLHLYWGTC